MAEEKHQLFTAEISAGLTFWGDRELLTQMIANIVENAMKHSPNRSSITVTTSASPSSVAVAVSDSGPGIPAGERLNVFRRLYRLERSRSTPGSGLGLSLVAAIAALHQIRIEVTDNEPGLRVTLRFQAPGQNTRGENRLASSQMQGERAVQRQLLSPQLGTEDIPGKSIIGP
jgi:signal transduction histidine kinase